MYFNTETSCCFNKNITVMHMESGLEPTATRDESHTPRRIASASIHSNSNLSIKHELKIKKKQKPGIDKQILLIVLISIISACIYTYLFLLFSMLIWLDYCQYKTCSTFMIGGAIFLFLHRYTALLYYLYRLHFSFKSMSL